MNIFENAIWDCDTMECLARLPDESKDLIMLSAQDSGAYSPPYEGYDVLLYQRIQQLHRVASKRGAVFMESGQHDLSLVRKYMDEFFGRRCFIREFIVPTGYYFRTGEHGKRPSYETLVGYSKTPGFELGPIERDKEEIERLYPKSDEKGRFCYVDITQLPLYPNTTYEFQGVVPHKGRSWRYRQEQMNELFAEGIVVKKNDRLVKKRYLKKEDEYRHAPVLWDDLAWAETENRKWSHQAYPLRLLKIAAKEGFSVLDLSFLGQRVVDPCIDAGYAYLGRSDLKDFLYRKRNPEIVTANRELYRGIIREVHEHEIQEIPIQPITYKRLQITREDKFANLILTGETQEVEFKESAAYNHRTGKKDKDLIAKILKVIVALANTKTGGTLLVGVTDEGSLVDLRKEEYQFANPQKGDSDGYCLYLNDCIGKGTSKLVLSLCTIEILNIDDADLCVIQVRPSERPVFYKGDYYRRQGTQDQKYSTEDFYDKIMLDEMEYGAGRMAVL